MAKEDGTRKNESEARENTKKKKKKKVQVWGNDVWSGFPVDQTKLPFRVQGICRALG